MLKSKKKSSDGKRDDRENTRRRDNDPRKKRRKVCFFCANKTVADYKNADVLRKFITERGKIMTQRSTGCCAGHQRLLAIQIKRARQMGLIPYTAE